MRDGLRLAVGTFTRVPVRPPSRLDRETARDAMLWGPFVGAVLALPAALLLLGVDVVAPSARLLGAALAIALLAWATRGLHLDGLADVADALGVKNQGDDDATRARRLAVMKAPETGVFGVLAVLLTVLVQVAALTSAESAPDAAAALVVSVAAGRLAVVWMCARGIPSARTDGLGAFVAGSVPRGAAAVVTVVVLVLAMLLGQQLDRADGPAALTCLVALGAAAALGTLLAWWWAARLARRAFGGITGDLLGAACEVATTMSLLVAVLAPAVAAWAGWR